MTRPRQRANGEGTVYENVSRGRFEGMLVTGYRPDGTVVRKKVTGKTKAEVRKKLAELRRLVEGGADNVDRRITVASYAKSWAAEQLAVRDVMDSTRTNYQNVLDGYLVPTFGRRTLAKLSPAHVEYGLAQLARDGLASNTIRLTKVVLGMVCDAAERDGILGRNPCRTARLPKARAPKERRAMTPAQAEKLLDNTAGTALHTPILVALATGLRPGELLTVRWNDLDLKSDPPTLRVRQAKTKKGRRVLPLPQPAVDALQAHHTDQACHARSTQSAWQDEDLVFPSTIGTPWNLANFRHRFQEACRTAKIGDWTPHELRHTTASWLIARGVSMKVVGELLGHSGISVTADVYGHLFGPSKEVADVLGSILSTSTIGSV